jgi:serine/threonine protein kinase
MDFINGGELFHHLSNEKRFTEDRTRFYAAQIVLGMEYLHQIGVIYRDLKPENLLLSAKGIVIVAIAFVSKREIEIL